MSDFVMHTRREFFHRGLALLSAGATVPLFLDRTAWAVTEPEGVLSVGSKPGKSKDRILVVVQLAGGNDGLNTVIPFEDDLYHRARPRLAIGKGDVLKLTDQIGLHPSCTGFKEMFDSGDLAIIQGVGYPNPDRSHFVSTDIWSTGDPEQRLHDGWLGRYFDCTCSGRDRPDPKKGIAITQETPLAMLGSKFRPVSFSSPEELSWRGPGAMGPGLDAFDQLNRPGKNKKLPEAAPRDEQEALNYLERAAMDARAGAEEIQDAAGATGRAGRRQRLIQQAGVGRRGQEGLEQQLGMVRRMIAAGLPTQVYYVSMGGFDTHVGQADRHRRLLERLGSALAGFVRELKGDGLLDRVLVMTFSEFGRRVAENGSQGTDHGAAAPLFVMGGGVKAGLHGSSPSLKADDLDQGDVKWGVDFRSIYAGVLTRWLRADAQRVLGGKFAPFELFR